MKDTGVPMACKSRTSRLLPHTCSSMGVLESGGSRLGLHNCTFIHMLVQAPGSSQLHNISLHSSNNYRTRDCTNLNLCMFARHLSTNPLFILNQINNMHQLQEPWLFFCPQKIQADPTINKLNHGNNFFFGIHLSCCQICEFNSENLLFSQFCKILHFDKFVN